MRTNPSPLSLLFFLLGACGAARPGGAPTMAGGEEASVTVHGDAQTAWTGSDNEAWEDLLTQDASLDEQFELQSFDCGVAQDLVRSICGLADRVCEIADDTGEDETVERCVDGRGRCERAQDRTAARCP